MMGGTPAAYAAPRQALRGWRRGTTLRVMWNEPYLETCCRSALHRLLLAGAAGRPGGLKDGPCLERLAGDGFAVVRADGRYGVTEAGVARHGSEIEPVGK